MTTASGPSYEDPRSAIVVPTGSETYVTSVNGEAVHTDFFDRLANLSLNIFLMYLEPQVFVRPGNNVLGLRGSSSNSVNYGYYTVKTTRWRDYLSSLNAEAGKRYRVQAWVDKEPVIALDGQASPTSSALASNDVPSSPPEAAPTSSAKKGKRSSSAAKASKRR